MTQMVKIRYQDLFNAFDFLNFGQSFENRAYVSLDTGKIFLLSFDESVFLGSFDELVGGDSPFQPGTSTGAVSTSMSGGRTEPSSIISSTTIWTT